MEEINGISEETAQELIKAFTGLEDSLEGFEKTYNEAVKNFLVECEIKAAEKLTYYMSRLIGATFLTRWYWLKKVRKYNEKLKAIAKLSEEILKEE